MAKLSHSLILSLVLSVTVVTIVSITWSDRMTICGPIFNSDWNLLRSQFSTDPPTTTDPPDLTPIPVLYQKNFTKMPQWDFDDVYRTDPQTHKSTQKCEASLWQKIQSDPELRHKFIPNIRMFVYNGSISMSEWNRLSHFNNPFGFMDYTHEEVLPTLSLVHKPKIPLLMPKPGRDCISCAVVANGGVLWRSNKGAEIDAHDYVFRVNGAVIKGFERDVGNRTDIYVHTAYSIISSEILLGKYNYTRAPHDKDIKYVLIPEGSRDYKWIHALYKHEILSDETYKGYHPGDLYSGQFNASRFFVLHMDFLRYVKNRFLVLPRLETEDWAITRPTNGAFMAFLALQHCDKVDLYGFFTENYKKYSNYYWEKDNLSPVIFYKNHEYQMEGALWRQLHDMGIVKLYMGEPEKERPTGGHTEN